MVQGILGQLTDLGVIAVVLAEVAFAALIWLAILWRPRHKTHRAHDCRSLGCRWLDDRPTR